MSRVNSMSIDRDAAPTVFDADVQDMIDALTANADDRFTALRHSTLAHRRTLATYQANLFFHRLAQAKRFDVMLEMVMHCDGVQQHHRDAVFAHYGEFGVKSPQLQTPSARQQQTPPTVAKSVKSTPDVQRRPLTSPPPIARRKRPIIVRRRQPTAPAYESNYLQAIRAYLADEFDEAPESTSNDELLTLSDIHSTYAAWIERRHDATTDPKRMYPTSFTRTTLTKALKSLNIVSRQTAPGFPHFYKLVRRRLRHHIFGDVADTSSPALSSMGAADVGDDVPAMRQSRDASLSEDDDSALRRPRRIIDDSSSEEEDDAYESENDSIVVGNDVIEYATDASSIDESLHLQLTSMTASKKRLRRRLSKNPFIDGESVVGDVIRPESVVAEPANVQ